MKTRSRTVVVHDMMQKNYSYTLTEPEGKNFDLTFKPDLSPKELLALGVFGGRYMRDCKKEFPRDWFTHAKFHPEGLPGHDRTLNFFGVDASQPLHVWREKGWLNENHDPRGWFQWYCRYWMGRRLPDEDERQIKRWRNMRRHIAQLRTHCRTGDFSCRTKQRQALLHWAYDSRRL